MVKNSLGFCSKKKVFISPSLFEGYCCWKPRILGWWVFFSSALERAHCLLAHMIYDGKPFHSHCCSSVCNNLFSLFAFKIFLLSLAFSNLIMTCLGVSFYIYPAWGLLRFCGFILFFFNQIQKICSHYFFKNISCYFFLSLSCPSMTHMLDHLVSYHTKLCSFSPQPQSGFFLCFIFDSYIFTPSGSVMFLLQCLICC